MTKDSKSSKYFCIIMGVILFCLFILGFYKESNAEIFQGRVEKVYNISEDRKKLSRHEPSSTYYSADMEVFYNGNYDTIKVSRKHKNSIPKE